MLAQSQNCILECVVEERALDHESGELTASPDLPLSSRVPHFPTFKMKWLGERGLYASLCSDTLLFCGSLFHTCQKHLTFFKLLKPAFQLDPSRSLFPLAVGNSKALLLQDFICLLLTADSELYHLKGSLASLKD